MSKILNSQFEGELVYNVDCIVENKEYNPWKEKLTDQILSNVEVQGFRKGKAPRDLAIKQVDIIKMEQTILEETINKFGTDLLSDIKEDLKKQSRVIQNQTVSLDPELTGKKDEGFKFRLILNLLPKVDLSPIEKIKTPKLKKGDMPKRLSKEEFIAKEKSKFVAAYNQYSDSEEVIESNDKVTLDVSEEIAKKDAKDLKDVVYTLGVQELPEDFESNLIGLKKEEEKSFSIKLKLEDDKTQTAKYKVVVKNIQKPTYKTIEEIIENNEEAKKQFPSEEKLQEFLDKYYDQETGVIEDDLKRREIIKTVIDEVPDFELPEDRVSAEEERIFGVIKSQSESQKISLEESLNASGINQENVETKTEDEVKSVVKKFVGREFKWIFILRAIYEFEVEEKITPEQNQETASAIEKDPAKFNATPNASNEYYKEIAFDRLMRSKSSTWIFNKVLNKDNKAVSEA